MSTKFSKPVYCILKPIVCVALWPFCRTKYTNKNNVPSQGRYIYAPNHVSFADAILVTLGQRRFIRFMAKAELFEKPLSRWFFTKIGAFPVDRSANDGSAIKTAMDIIDSGDAVGIFIEGTRSKTGELLRPRSGAVMIAHQMNCKIIPVSITYRSKKNSLFSKRYVSFGDPVTTEELGVITGSPREFREASRALMEKIRVMWERDKYGN